MKLKSGSMTEALVRLLGEVVRRCHFPVTEAVLARYVLLKLGRLQLCLLCGYCTIYVVKA